VGLECSRYNLPCSIYKKIGAKPPQFLTFQQLKMAGNKEVVADSDSEWGSDAEEEAPKKVAREEVESGDETEELASETEDEGETGDEEDDAEAKKAAEAKAKKKADALKAKKAAEAKAKKDSEPAKPKPPAKPKVAKSPSKKRKAEGEKPPAASKPAAESKKAEAPAKPKAPKPPEVFATQPLKDGTREGMSAQQECDAFLAHIRAKNNEHQSAVDTFIKAASSDKGKQPKSTVSTFHSILARHF